MQLSAGPQYDQEEQASAVALKQLVRTLLLLLSTAVYLTYLWITAIAAAPTDARAFLLPFLLALALGSGLVQVGLNTLLRQRYSATDIWVVLGSACFHQHLQQELLWARQTTRLEQACLHVERFVVEDFNALIPEHQQHLLQPQAEGGLLLSALGWSEQVLQRFPPDLLQPTDLLRGEFAAPHGSLQKRLKRHGDVLVSAVMLLLLSALLIRLEDLGPCSMAN